MTAPPKPVCGWVFYDDWGSDYTRHRTRWRLKRRRLYY